MIKASMLLKEIKDTQQDIARDHAIIEGFKEKVNKNKVASKFLWIALPIVAVGAGLALSKYPLKKLAKIAMKPQVLGLVKYLL